MQGIWAALGTPLLGKAGWTSTLWRKPFPGTQQAELAPLPPLPAMQDMIITV